jgi:hypothetical protein
METQRNHPVTPKQVSKEEQPRARNADDGVEAEKPRATTPVDDKTSISLTERVESASIASQQATTLPPCSGLTIDYCLNL